LGGGFSCVAKGGIHAGDKFEVSGEIQMEAKARQTEREKPSKEDDEEWAKFLKITCTH